MKLFRHAHYSEKIKKRKCLLIATNSLDLELVPTTRWHKHMCEEPSVRSSLLQQQNKFSDIIFIACAVQMGSSVGDIRNNMKILQNEIRHIKYPDEVDYVE